MPALVGCQTIGDGAIGGLLQFEIERGFHAQAGLVDLFGAEALFEFLADFFLKPRRNRHLRLGDVQAERSAARLFCLLMGDHAVRLHFGEHQVAAAQGFFGIEDGGIRDGSFGQARQQRGFSEVQILGMLAEVVL